MTETVIWEKAHSFLLDKWEKAKTKKQIQESVSISNNK